eukprot:9476839-Pyramimonas_sp.AAC.1
MFVWVGLRGFGGTLAAMGRWGGETGEGNTGWVIRTSFKVPYQNVRSNNSFCSQLQFKLRLPQVQLRRGWAHPDGCKSSLRVGSYGSVHRGV